MPAPSLSSHPHAQFPSLFLTLSQSLTCFFSTHLPFHSDTLHALCVTFDKRPSQERSRATSVHLIRFSLITQPLSEHRALVCGYAGCLLGFVCSRLFIVLFIRANRINGEVKWSNHSLCMGQQAYLSPVVGTMTHPWSPAPIYVTSTAMISFSLGSFLFFF